MRKMWVIAAREYRATVQTKAFLIGLIIMPIMMGGSILVQVLLKDFKDTKELKYAVIDRSGDATLALGLQGALYAYNQSEAVIDKSGKQIAPRFAVEVVEVEDPSSGAVQALREQLSTRIRKGEINGILEIGSHVLEPVTLKQALGTDAPEERSLRYQTNRPTQMAFPMLARETIGQLVQAQRAAEAGMDVARLPAVTRAVPLINKGLTVRNANNELVDAPDQGRFAPVIVPLALTMLMFMIVLIGSTPLMQGVVEEKMQRIAEVLLGSVRPFELMLGKLIGMTGVSLTMSAVYLGGAYWAARHYGQADNVGPDLIAWFIFYQSLASLMFGSLFIAVGAACTDMKETQTLLWPVMLLATLPMFVLGNVLQEPNSTVVTGLSFFPFATPALMIARQAIPPGIPLWQPLVGAAIVLLTTILCVYAAGRIFRVGILLQGKGADFRQMLRWVING